LPITFVLVAILVGPFMLFKALADWLKEADTFPAIDRLLFIPIFSLLVKFIKDKYNKPNT
ncbi:hypothetical protein CI088_01920, partial [Enterococcus plantarum]